MEGARLLPFVLQEISYTGITTGGFTLAGEIQQPLRLGLIQNLTDQLLIFSWDSVTPHFVLPSCSSWTIDIATNRNTAQTASLPTGYGVYVQAPGVLPTTGSVYFSYFYAQ